MGRLKHFIPELQDQLTRARADQINDIAEAISYSPVVGVTGEPEVGLTTLTEAATARDKRQIVRVDLDGVASNGDVEWLIARALSSALLGANDASLLLGPRELLSGKDRNRLFELEGELGPDLAHLATAQSPPLPNEGGQFGAALDAFARLARDRPMVLWLDHIETPGLTHRHPVKVDELLWQVRSRQQHVSSFGVVLTMRRPAVRAVTRKDAAFFGGGEWISIERPDLNVWKAVAKRLPEAAPAQGWLGEMIALTQAHPQSMLLAWCYHQLNPAWPPEELFRTMVSLDDGLVGRAMQHARSLHRLGGHVLNDLAHGLGPYEEANHAQANEIYSALRRLHLAGLVTQPEPRKWVVTNPLVSARLRGSIGPTSAAIPGLYEPHGLVSTQDLMA